jgi:hypothetical protein
MAPDTIRIVFKNADLFNLLRALNSLDGRPGAPLSPGAPPEVIPYKFGGKARLSLARWLAAVKAANDALGRTHDGLVRQFAAPGATEVSKERKQEFSDEWDKVLDDTTAFELPKIAVEDLNVEENLLPVSVLAVISPILA